MDSKRKEKNQNQETMPRKIELFVQTKEHIQRDKPPTEHMQEAHTKLIFRDNENLISSIHNWMSDDEIKVKKIVEEFAKSQHLELIIYDRARFWDDLRARFKGISTTPAVILGKHKFTANITQDRLKNHL